VSELLLFLDNDAGGRHAEALAQEAYGHVRAIEATIRNAWTPTGTTSCAPGGARADSGKGAAAGRPGDGDGTVPGRRRARATKVSLRDVRLLHLAVAQALIADLRCGEEMDCDLLRRRFEEETGRSGASGACRCAWPRTRSSSPRPCLFSISACPLLTGTPGELLGKLEAFAARLALQSYRSESQFALQRFSISLPLAFLAALTGRAKRGELAPDSPVGSRLPAWSTVRAGDRLLLNELDRPTREPRRGVPQAVRAGHGAERTDGLLR